jgi:cold shock CspA family protein
MQLKGKLIKWNNEKVFGFIAPNGGGEHVFIHKTAFSNRQRTPQINNVITFSITKDNQGRFCADEAIFSGEKLIKRQAKSINKFSIYLSVIFLGIKGIKGINEDTQCAELNR